MSELFATIDLQSADVEAQIDRACRTVGFFQLVGHGVDPGIVAEMRAEVARFFALPIAAKLACRPASPDANRGYISRGAETSGYSVGLKTPPDLFEAFNIGGGPGAGPHVRPDLRGLFAPNIWPEQAPQLRIALSAYFEAMVPLSSRLLRLFASALDLAPGWFDGRVDAAPDTLRVIHYEAGADSPGSEEGQLGMGPHTDYGVLTILLADPLPGLEVLGPDGKWHGLIPEDGSFIINVGDLTAQWTNDRWVSSLHRVLPPHRRPDGVTVRRSVPFFKEANPDTLVACLPSCCSAENPARYTPVTAGEHLMAKLLGPRLNRPAAAASTVGDRAAAVGITGRSPTKDRDVRPTKTSAVGYG